jgi:hypothetical protein
MSVGDKAAIATLLLTGLGLPAIWLVVPGVAEWLKRRKIAASIGGAALLTIVLILFALPGTDSPGQTQSSSSTNSSTISEPPQAATESPGSNIPSPAADVLASGTVCRFYGEGENKDDGKWRKVERCVIPSVESLDQKFQQGDFKCCEGGGASTATTSDIPHGVEVRTLGHGAWSVNSPRLMESVFSLQTSCAGEYSWDPCKVNVEIIAHYRNRDKK